MVEPCEAAPEKPQRVFVSYSRSDRHRVAGLALLLEALGHIVFVDHKTILPGSRWDAELHKALEQAEVLLVYWTKSAARSERVRKEYEYTHVHFPERLLVPILGDETPLSEILKVRQHADFAPLINELLEQKRQLERGGANQSQIREALLSRLRDAGIELDGKDQKTLFKFFAPAGTMALIAFPTAMLQTLGSSTLEAVAQLSSAQAVVVGAGAILGGAVCGVIQYIEPAAVQEEPHAECGSMLQAWQEHRGVASNGAAFAVSAPREWGVHFGDVGQVNLEYHEENRKAAIDLLSRDSAWFSQLHGPGARARSLGEYVRRNDQHLAEQETNLSAKQIIEQGSAILGGRHAHRRVYKQRWLDRDWVSTTLEYVTLLDGVGFHALYYSLNAELHDKCLPAAERIMQTIELVR